MATFELIIRGELAELAGITAALDAQGAERVSVGELVAGAEAEPAAPKPSRSRRSTASAAEPASATSVFATPASSVSAEATPGPSATSTDTAAGVVTYDSLKDLMTELLKKKSASVAQQVIRDATGQSSLSACTVDQYPAAHAALVAALA